MAWIHPETNGDYRIIGVTTTGPLPAEFLSLNDYTNEVITSVGNNAELATVAQQASWLPLISVVPGGDAINLLPPTDTSPLYNMAGDQIAINAFALWGSSILNPVNYYLDGTLVGSPETVWTGTASDGHGEPDRRLGFNGIGFHQTGSTSDVGAGNWISVGFDFFPDHPIYGFSPNISTIGGSISGTLSRAQSEIWAVGAITLTGDTDFGGTVDLKAALDVSQVPPTPDFGLFKLSVGIGGTAPAGWPDFSERRASKNAGTNNTIEGEIGAAAVAGGVAYE